MTSASLAISAGWIAGSGPSLSQRADPPTTMLSCGHEHEDEQDDGDDVERRPTPAAGSGSRSRIMISIAAMPEKRPLDLRTDGRERVGVLRQVAPQRRRRVDHQDADRGQGHDHDEDHVVGLVALAAKRAGPALDRGAVGRRPLVRAAARCSRRSRSRRGMGGARFIGSPPARRSAASVGDRRLERPAARRVVDEHVEAGRGRAEQHGGDRSVRGLPVSRASRASRSARPDGRLEVGRPLGEGQAGGAEGRLERRAALADEDRRDGALGDDRRQPGQVDVLVAAAGDQHDRRVERAERGDHRVRLGPLRVVDEAHAIDQVDRLEPVLDAGERSRPQRGSRRARRRMPARPRSRPARWTRCARPGSPARRWA